MTSRHHKAHSSLLGSCLMLASAAAIALNSDDQQLYITAAQQSVDMATNTVTMNGDVVVKRGSIAIHADKVVITRPDDVHEIVEGYGRPVTFYQLHSDGKQVRGHAHTVRYETAHELVIFTGQAYLEQLESNINCDRIAYLVKNQQLEAFSDTGKLVTTVLVPAYLQHNNSDAK